MVYKANATPSWLQAAGTKERPHDDESCPVDRHVHNKCYHLSMARKLCLPQKGQHVWLTRQQWEVVAQSASSEHAAFKNISPSGLLHFNQAGVVWNTNVSCPSSTTLNQVVCRRYLGVKL